MRRRSWKAWRAASLALPADFVAVVTGYAARVAFRWHLGDAPDAPVPFSEVFAGWAEALWDVEQLSEYQRDYAGWVRDVFPDPSDPYDAVWHGKTPFLYVPNKDYIAFDNRAGEAGHAVVYLSHDDGELHGRRLGLNFIDFVSRWSRLGCPGPEGWQLQPFHDPEADLLMEAGETVARWRAWVETGH